MLQLRLPQTELVDVSRSAFEGLTRVKMLSQRNLVLGHDLSCAHQVEIMNWRNDRCKIFLVDLCYYRPGNMISCLQRAS